MVMKARATCQLRGLVTAARRLTKTMGLPGQVGGLLAVKCHQGEPGWGNWRCALPQRGARHWCRKIKRAPCGAGPYLDAQQLDGERGNIDDGSLWAEVVGDGPIVCDHRVDVSLWLVRPRV